MADSTKAQLIFQEALGREPEERDAYLEEACGRDGKLRHRVNELLAVSESEGLLPEPHALGDSQPTIGMGGTAAEVLGTVIGPFHLLEKLGEGGFGTVWLAQQQEPIRRQVALKIIKAGMDSEQVISRFEAERQTLALLDHPGIAKVFDAGTTERGRPYFVMELVKGEQIVKYCDRAQLDTRARLDLFTKVCQAIQHAHQKGIIHRDIKPGNVMVTVQEGVPVPKVIDFGIAKATGAEATQLQHLTLHNEMIGTPLYMSPEQAAMTHLDIDTRSDIYSLGVLLYELLTGVMPFDAEKLIQKGFVEMMWALREGEPPRPSTRVSGLGDTAARVAAARRSDARHLASSLRGDLDWIVMRCLEKDRERRYETAGALVEDIRRHLNHEPVAAGPPSAGYRLRKFARRNRTAVAAGLLAAAAMVLGALGATWGLIQSRREQTRTAAALAELEQVTAFQAGQLSGIDTRLMGVRLREDILEKAGTVLAGRSLSERMTATTAAELESLLAEVNFTDVALVALDENIFERALTTIEHDFADRPLIKARLLQAVAWTLSELGLLRRAMAPQEEALKIRRRVLGDEHIDTLRSIDNMATLLSRRGKLEEAEALYREALDGRRRVLGDENAYTLVSISNIANVFLWRGKIDEAERYHRQALEIHRRVLGDEHIDTLRSINNLGNVFWRQRRLDEAELLFREALDGFRRVKGNEDPHTLMSINNLASVLREQGKLDEAEPLHREALEGQRRTLGDAHPSTLRSINNMAIMLHQLGRPEDAEPLYREALEVRRRMLGNHHRETLSSIDNMAFYFRREGRLDEAEPLHLEALEGRRRVLGDSHPDTLATMRNLVWLYKARHAAEPGAGHDQSAAKWRARFEAARNEPSAKP